jgi:FemAB-related protein (PEP-CTERM system-associated)
VRVRLLRDEDGEAWDRYVLNHANGTLFHQIAWKRVVEKSFGHKSHYLLAEDSPAVSASSAAHPEIRICGLFPLFSVKSLLFGRCMVSVPFATYGGILCDREEVKTALFEKAVEITRSMKLEYLELRNHTTPLPGLPVKDLYYVFEKEVFPDEEANLNAIPRKTRRMVRQGMKNELETRLGGAEHLDCFYELFAFSYRGFGTPVFSKRYLRNLMQEFGARSSVLVILKDGRPLSGVLSFYFKDQVIPYYSGSYPEAKNHAANDYLYWVLMRDAAVRGCRKFDFGRSKKDTGPFDFKRHWGFEPRALPYQYYLNTLQELPNISPANPKYQKKIETWKKLPLWATKIIGPQIVKYIP